MSADAGAQPARTQVPAAAARRTTRILVVDDDAMVRAWLRLQLAGPEFQVVADAACAQEGLAQLAEADVQLVILDQRLPDMPGSDFVRALRLKGDRRRVLMMTSNRQDGFNQLARRSGANGTLLKNSDPEQLLAALRTLRAGRSWFDPRHPSGGAALSPRELEVVRLAAAGHTNEQIAGDLGVGYQTVKTLLGRAYAKLEVGRRAEAVSEAVRLGLL